MKLIKKLLSLFFMLPFFCLAQKTEHIEINKNYSVEKVTPSDFKSFIEYRNNVKQVINADKFTYYGFDVSNLIVSDSEKTGLENKVNIYLQAWIDRFHKMVPYYEIRKMLKAGKKDFDTSFQAVQLLSQQKKVPWITKENFSISINDLAGIVESYKLDEKEGIGFVVIAENFNKKGTYSSAYFTFFDIASRQILWATRAKMEPTGFGWTVYWMRGIIDAFYIFKGEVYEKQRRIVKHEG